MNILSFDTSSKAASVSIMMDNILVGEIVINDKRTHSQKLMPMLENLFSLANVKVEDIDLLGVCIGPGSFTGLRIAMATVKAMSHVRSLPIVAVDSLEGLANNVSNSNTDVVPILDAQGTNVYTSWYSDSKRIRDIEVLDIDELINTIKVHSKNVIVLGEAVGKYKEKLRMVKNIEFVTSEKNILKASSIGTIAIKKYNAGVDIYNCYDILPMYIRKSQAEIQYEERHNENNI